MYTCIIIDDDLISTTQLKRLLALVNNIKVITSFSNPKTALQFVQNNTIDIIFLDIKMPIMNGIDFALECSNSTIIFTTSSSEYAIESYNIGAIDYLLKPIDDDRLCKAITKAIDNIEIKKLKEKTESNTAEPHILTLIADRKSYQINIDDIIYVESLKEYVFYYLATQKLLCIGALKDVYDKLPPEKFVRIHRSYIINKTKIKQFTATTVVLCNDIQLTIGRLYKEVFRQALQ